ncbi:bi-domain-containing oxidoreductase [Clostridium coskatii]|uniref:4-carboxy-2-hydroxymuconate-6-semialdehyde dehydrogenase n=1 Tax=Clostridium coskatii TaxID=1705578 RepID=A0A170NNW3_9CLOT|nr:bi-domain-containing oxidoreductase [Clostridium coskatii]OAA94197.1 4-carboxy-2-hydroxymuconate-6-semialdehyde dehydrogenase [Clostridium coskatii]OBR95533.1 4-carboxy-2-hydroxymuconate-6-semialdehyde dehydrogenase [Clostridium coskatii]
MKQVLVKQGQTIVDNIPAPVVSDNGVLVKVLYSCISAGTEMMGVNESGKSIIKKAMEQPEKVKKALNMFKNQGISSVLNKVKNMESAKPTGYSASGIILGLGKNVKDLKVGDRVACAGAGLANHAEYIDVPRNLVMRVPDKLNMDLAATVTVGGIAMQGVRRADLRLGETAAVIGMGIMGQLSVQMLKTSGCKVIGIDIDDRRLSIAKETGCNFVMNSSKVDAIKEVDKITEGYGVDAVIITAAANSNEILSEAFNICRRKGKVVLVGVVGNQYKREDMYEKELDFIISTSYGPGRYDSNYEEKGIDYPYAYVRWTENRNMEEYLKLLSESKVDLKPLIERVYSIDEAPKAYNELKDSKDKPLIVLLKYSQENKDNIERKVYINSTKAVKKDDKINVAVVGVGGFAKGMHLPNLKKLDNIYNIYAIMSRTGTNAKAIAEQYGAAYATTDYSEILNDSNVDMIMICTRHNLHTDMSIEAMKKGKSVFVEKPMALNEEEMDRVLETINETNVPYTIGFNRRFSKYAVEAKNHIANRINPMIINYQMNAGYIPLDHWVHTEEGGGRIIGEGCHIFDLFNYFTDSKVTSVSVDSIDSKSKNISPRDNVVATLKYDDGSLCTLTYTSIGNGSYPKEFCQIYCDGKIITIDDYKKLNGYGVKLQNIESKASEKGQYEELVEFAKAIKEGKNYSIPIWQLEQATKVSYLVEQELVK